MRSHLNFYILSGLTALAGVGFFGFQIYNRLHPEWADNWVKESLDGEGEENVLIENLIAKAESLEIEKHFDEAIGIFKTITQDYRDAMYEDEVLGPQSYSELAQYKIEVAQCRRHKGDEYLSKDPKELMGEVRNAIMSLNMGSLLSLASCEFQVGIFESDVFHNVPPQKREGVLKNLASFMGRSRWEGPSFENYGTREVVHALFDSANRIFIFSFVNGAWQWTGFLAGSEESYQSIIQAKL